MVRAIYARSLSIGGALIRASSWWEQWSHCGLLTADNTVINARAFHGVVEEPLGEFVKRYSWTETVALNLPRPEDAVKWARAQIGSGYDYGAIINMVSRKFGVQESPHRWECVELLETAKFNGGLDIWRKPLAKVTVAQSYMVKT